MLLCHLSEAVAAPLSRGDSPKHGDSERIREQAPRRGYNAIEYFNRLLAAGADGLFRVPSNPEDIWPRLRHCLDEVVCELNIGPEPWAERRLQEIAFWSQASVREISGTVGNFFTGCRVSFGPRGDDNRSDRISFEKIRKHLPGLRCSWDARLGRNNFVTFSSGLT